MLKSQQMTRPLDIKKYLRLEENLNSKQLHTINRSGQNRDLTGHMSCFVIKIISSSEFGKFAGMLTGQQIFCWSCAK